jgi:SAM-dependent methyltransferase
LPANEVERARWNDARWARMWPKRERLTDEVTPRLLERAALRAGERVLDVGCGGGRTALAAAGVVAADGAVLGADLSQPLLSLARERARAAGAANVAFEQIDVQTAAVPGAPFDAAISQFGVMFFDEPITAFANIRAQLRPAGRLTFACWQAPELNPWIFAASLRHIFPPPPAPAPGKSATGPFSLADPEHTDGILRAAGFEQIVRTPYVLDAEAPLEAVYDEEQLELVGIPVDDRAAADAAVRAHLQPFAIGPDHYRFPLAVQIFQASTP